FSRLHHVKDEDAAGRQRDEDAAEELPQGAVVVARIEEIADAFAERGDGVAWRDVGLKQGGDAELGPRGAASCQSDHRLGNVYAEHVVAALDELLGPQS